jgi:hypothetical protein
MNVIIKNDIEKSVPEHPFDGEFATHMKFRKGEKIKIVIINYPGNHRQQPEDRYSKYSNCDSWVFQSVYLHPEFFADEIDALILTPQERESLTLWGRGDKGELNTLILTPQERESLADVLFNSAPFEVIVREEDRGTIVRIHSKKLNEPPFSSKVESFSGIDTQLDKSKCNDVATVDIINLPDIPEWRGIKLGKAKNTGRVDVVNLPDISQLRRIKVQEALNDPYHEWKF